MLESGLILKNSFKESVPFFFSFLSSFSFSKSRIPLSEVLYPSLSGANEYFVFKQ